MGRFDEAPIEVIAMSRVDTKTVANCRESINPADCLELAASIKRDGLLFPILVVRQEDKGDGKDLALTAGFRRFTAHKINHAETITARILDSMPMEDALTLNLTENIEREDLNPMQEARALKKLRNLTGSNEKELGIKLNKSKTWIDVRLMAAELESAIQTDIEEGHLNLGDVKKLYEIPAGEERYAAVRAIKTARLRGERPKLGKKKFKEVAKPKRREKMDINDLQDHIVDTIGSGYFSKLPQEIKYILKALGWAAGEGVSDIEVHAMFREIAQNHGLYYEIPEDIREAVQTV